MAQPFLRIDLSNQASDFQNTVIEAGWPLIDKANANAQILHKWLGSSVASFERKGDEVVYYLRNESGARIDQPLVLRANDKELTGAFQGQFLALLQKLQAAQPKNTAEQNLHKKALEELKALTTEKRAGDRRCSLFKYRGDDNKWHLVWAPGYRRKDEQPANPIICTRAECCFLYLQRADGDNKCPRCKKVPGRAPVGSGDGVTKSRLPLIAALVLLLMLLIGGGWWWMNREAGEDPQAITEPVFAVSPASAKITVDGQLELKGTFTDAEGQKTDVSGQLSVGFSPPNLAIYDIYYNKVKPLSVGKTTLTVRYRKKTKDEEKIYKQDVELEIQPARNPNRLTLEPATLVMGLGTTTSIKLMGDFGNDQKEELTTNVVWDWDASNRQGIIAVDNGNIEALKPGKTTLKVRYRSSPKEEYLTVEAPVEVKDLDYKDLHLAMENPKFGLGQDPGLTVEVETQTGEKMSVLGSVLLHLEVEPHDLGLGQKQPPYLIVSKPGKGKLTATFGGKSKSIEFEAGVSSSGETEPLAVNPKNLKLAVGEMSSVDVPHSPTGEPTRYSSDNLNVVEVTSKNRLIGKTPGRAKVTIKRGDQTAVVNVEVAVVELQGITLVPNSLSVRVDDTEAVRVMGHLKDGTQIELDPLIVEEWIRDPSGESLEVNRQGIDVTGLSPTGTDPKSMHIRLGKHEATSTIRVIPGALQLVLEPSEPGDLPVGQKQPLRVFAIYGNGERKEVSANRVDWKAELGDGMLLQNGEVTATKPGASLTVHAEYLGQKSNEVTIASAETVPIELVLSAEPSELAIGETGQVLLKGKTPGGQVVELDLSEVKFESGKPAIIEVNPDTGGFRAVAEGTAMITATHPKYDPPQPVEIVVSGELPNPRISPKPAGLQIVSSQPQPIELPVGVGFVDYQVLADLNGQDVNVKEDAVLIVEGDVQAIAVRGGRIYGVRPGSAVVKAEFNGLTTEAGLKFTVTENLEIDEIQLDPQQISLSVEENARLEALGFFQGRNVGVITDVPNLAWKSDADSIVATDGSLITALASGTAGVTAQLNNITSNKATITVAGEGGLAGSLQVSPPALTLRPGESREMGRDVKVQRGSADLTLQTRVSSANTNIVSYDQDTRMLKAGLPGRTRVTMIVGNQTVDLDVTVLADAPVTAGGKVVIEPNTGTIAVGERLPIRVMLITAEGERINMTASALLNSEDANIVAVSTQGVRGVAEGTATITARVAGVEELAKATFKVEKVDFTRLEVNPPKWDLVIGQEITYEIFVVGPGGRRTLGNDPDLKQTYHTLSGHVEEWGSRITPITAKVRTNGFEETLVVRWKNLETVVPIRVSDNTLTGLVIRPADDAIEVGETLDYQVFAQRGGNLVPISNVDGVTLSVSNPAVASKNGAMRISGDSEGVTEILADYEGQRATARLRVQARTRSVPPSSRRVGLRFQVTSARMELGTPGDLIELVYVHSDGTTQAVTEKPTVTANPPGIVKLESQGNVPFITPATIGQTQLQAKVGSLETTTPMIVEVVDKLPGNPRLIVSPNPLILKPGEKESFARVAFIRAGGRFPNDAVNVPYKITATPNNVFDVKSDQIIQAKSVGRANATITMVDPKNKYDGMSVSAQVVVQDPELQTDLRNGGELVLRGPSQTTEGAESGFRVELVSGSNVQDVTGEASLVLDVDDAQRAELQPGCRLLAKQPGVVNVRARHAGQVSNAIRLRINPLAANFRRLALEVNEQALGIGETRNYRVWGYPQGQGTRQDLTHLITTDRTDANRPHVRFNVLEPSADAEVATHAEPKLVGKSPGVITLQAAIGDRVISNLAKIAVVKAVSDPLAIRVRPGAITARVGETTPALKVEVRTKTDPIYRELDPGLVDFASLDPETLTGIPELKGRFKAERPTLNPARIRVTYQGLNTTAEVKVVSDRFKTVTLGKFDVGTNTFKAPITISTDRIAGALEYRLYRKGASPGPQEGWKETTTTGQNQSVTLISDPLRLQGNDRFQLMIESRLQGDNTNKSLDSYPYIFTLEGSRAGK